MAFLDNSGDIILDAVLTDAGRRRLAQGNGSFRVAKYAFGDDEIDYGSYDPNNASGSAYYDLEILQTPILEAFTNNIASLKSKLITLTNNNLLYLPVIKMNNKVPDFYTSGTNSIGSGSYAVLVDQDTVTEFGGTGKDLGDKYIDGLNGPAFDGVQQAIRFDQGLDTTEISAVFNLDAELTENQYIVQLDNRFGTIVDTDNKTINPSYIDDDNIASYYISTSPLVTPLQANKSDGSSTDSVIAGPRGTKLEFSLLSSITLRTSTFLFDQVGTSATKAVSGVSYQYIDTTVKIQGATTGYQVDAPVRFIKKV
ncbi:MAG TPA: hypothetical protein EYN89_06680 [Flavobacteriales bacterium]|nr:hypothetical protein [Flavobacteriales bacterium]